MLNRALDHIEEWLIACFMAAATLIIFLAVLHRYALGIPWVWEYARQLDFNWAQELCIYLFIWMAKFGAAYGVRSGIHVGVDVLVRKLSAERQNFFIQLGLGLGAFFTFIVAVLGIRFVLFVHTMGQISPDLRLPMWIVYLAVPLGSSLMCYRFLQVLAAYRRSGHLPAHTYEVAGAAE
ncbi:MAG: C4-dicarboxylate ABC transporter permease [Betaproteobacteria bacterium RBG_16_58_11]|nr:MAG: C4-dicarboxylate ABC transporter permease [Betaproteobacteria bacterium RBG_16_58_11]OFZ98285.1 MAG: C4-dicarboxylate ABC transporter permease [Betaproteobacteria bacterium RBG_19FT_COMBO_58_11]